MENLKIIINNKKEQEKVVAKLEKEGCLMGNGLNMKPTEFKMFYKTFPMVIYLRNKKITQGTDCESTKTCKIISAKEYLDYTETIVIYRNGPEVIALDKSTGKRAIARCHPDDEFNFELGAKLAFVRLFDEVKEEPKETPISVGDIVRVIEVGLTYSAYSSWNGLGKYLQNFVVGKAPDDTKKYKVLNIAKHDFAFSELALIQDIDTTQVFIISIKGIRKE